MISDLEVASANSTYLVTLGLEKIHLSGKKHIFLCDEKLKDEALRRFPKDGPWIFRQASEDLKTFESCASILEEMAMKGVNRDYELVAIGGGAVQDIATLVASVYMRGIDWVYVPTTLMAMMDSCIGAKSSINVGPYKNLAGNFYAPNAIYIDPVFASTLSQEDLSCGIAEGAKICFASDVESFRLFITWIEKWRVSKSVLDLQEAIFLALNKKKWFIEIDEFDRKERKLLNFGHSFGHALEASTSFHISHGIAVLVGMQSALIHAKGSIVITALSDFIASEIVASGLKTRKLMINRTTFTTALSKDKKNTSEFLKLVLPNDDGFLEVVSFPLNQDSLEECFASTRDALDELGIDYEVL